MIAYLKGQIIDLKENSVIILTNSGVGYLVFINQITFSKLVNLDETELFIYNQITEVSNNLFGFTSEKEKEFFLELIKISGIGGKVAMNILGVGIQKLADAINSENEDTIKKIPGIGAKGASKIILEMKDKDIVKNIDFSGNNQKVLKKYPEEIFTTLVQMGFNAKKVDEVLGSLPNELQTAQQIIPYAIKNLS